MIVTSLADTRKLYASGDVNAEEGWRSLIGGTAGLPARDDTTGNDQPVAWRSLAANNFASAEKRVEATMTVAAFNSKGRSFRSRRRRGCGMRERCMEECELAGCGSRVHHG